VTNQFDVVQVPELAEEDGAWTGHRRDHQMCVCGGSGADEKLGTDTIVLGMSELLPVVDAFVVTSGRNVRQVRSMVDEIELQVKLQCDRAPVRVEGLRDGTGCSWTTATSSCTCSWKRHAPTTTRAPVSAAARLDWRA